jgi:hypothetical protein
MKKISCYISSFLLFFVSHANPLSAQDKIKAYFNNPVTNSVSRGVNAVYLPSGTMSDTIVAYINRAKYTVDIAQYDYNQSSNYGAYANIATAANNAHARGVTVRWLYDGGQSNSGLSMLNSGIHTLGRPGTSDGIMHDKFIIIDANSGTASDAVLCTGSADWSSEMFYKDYNNILFIQDAPLAQAYTAEFNMMWGSTTAVPNSSAAKFGNAKTDLGLHTFTIAGHTVELYFSPSDNTDAHIQSTILTANKDLYVGVYDITRTNDANAIVMAKEAGVYTLAIVDQYTPTSSSTVNSTLTSGLASNYIVYTGAYIYHNKMMIVDPSDSCSDPIVLTGSHNWTNSANQYNDENILIIHNDTLANIYYQSFINNFTTLGGSYTTVAGCGTPASVQNAVHVEPVTAVYPNPALRAFNITYDLPASSISSVIITNTMGEIVTVFCKNELQAAGTHSYVSNVLKSGLYFVSFSFGDERFVKKIVITE